MVDKKINILQLAVDTLTELASGDYTDVQKVINVCDLINPDLTIYLSSLAIVQSEYLQNPRTQELFARLAFVAILTERYLKEKYKVNLEPSLN